MLSKLEVYGIFEDLLNLIGLEPPTKVMRESYKDSKVYDKYKKMLEEEISYVKSKKIFIEQKGLKYLKDIRGLNIPSDHKGILNMDLQIDGENPNKYSLALLNEYNDIIQHVNVNLNYTDFRIRFDFSSYNRKRRSKELHKHFSRNICNNFINIKNNLFKIDILKNILWLMEDPYNELHFYEGRVTQSRSLYHVPNLLLTIRRYFLRMFKDVDGWESLLDDIKSPIMDDLMVLYLGHYHIYMNYTKYTLDTHPMTKNKTLTLNMHDDEAFTNSKTTERSIKFTLKNVFEIGYITISDLYDNVCVRETNFKIKPFKELIVSLFWRYFIRYYNVIKQKVEE